MPFNLLKRYNELLDLGALNETERKKSLLGVFNRDFAGEQITFRQKTITPTPIDGVIKMNTLFNHLITVMTDKTTRKREYDRHRAVRIHWVKHHLEEKKKDNIYVFSVKEREGIRTYIYDKDEKYVIVLEPLRKKDEYYLLTAYYLTGKDSKRDKIMSKYNKRRLDKVL